MDDDFNTPAALGVLFEMVAEVNKARDTDIDRACELGKLIVKLGNFLGILYSTPNEFLMGTESSDVDKNEIENDKRKGQEMRKTGKELMKLELHRPI